MDTLFGTDGIRGLAGRWPLTPHFILRIGQAFGTLLRKDGGSATVVIGRDTRESGPMLQSSLISGLLASGVDVYDVGVIPTPGVAALTRRLGASAGVVVSGSHNPVEQNGIKFFAASGQKLSDKTESEIERLANVSTTGSESVTDGLDRRWGQVISGACMHSLYEHELLSEHPDAFLKGIRLVMDCANGAAYEIAPQVFSKAGATIPLAIHCSPTGSNINVRSGSEYVRRTPKEMGELIRQYKATFGLAFDGDADRVVFVDEQGGLVDGDHMLGILAQYLNDRGQLLAGRVVTTTMRNTGLKHFIEAAAIKLEETVVGDKYVIERLVKLRREFPETKMLGLGGEQAGHIVLLDDQHLTGDGIRTALYVMRAFHEALATSLSEFVARVGKTPQVIASASVGELPRLTQAQLAEWEDATLAGTPGLIRANLRYSGTEPLFRVMLESDGRQSEDDLADIADALCAKVQSNAELAAAPPDILNCTNGGILRSRSRPAMLASRRLKQ